MLVRALRLCDVKSRWCWTGFVTRLSVIPLLLTVSISPRVVAAQGSNEVETAVVFYADPQVEAAVWPSLVDAFPKEVSRTEAEYPLPSNVEAVRGTSIGVGAEFG